MRPWFLLLLAPGCATFGTFQRAETLGKGGIAGAAEASVWGLGGEELDTTLPHVAVALRYGVTDQLDIGGRVGSNGGEVNAKVQLNAPGSAVPISLAPSLGGFAMAAEGTTIGLAAVQLPLLIGVPVGEHQLVLGPRLHDWTLFGGVDGGGGSVSLLSVGTSVGFAAQVSPGLVILPEVTVLAPYAAIGAAGGQTETAYVDEATVVMYQAGVGFVFGSARR